MGGLAAALGVFRLSEIGVADVVESEGFAAFCSRNEFAALRADDATVAAIVAQMLDAVPAVRFEFYGVEIADNGYDVLHFYILLNFNTLWGIFNLYLNYSTILLFLQIDIFELNVDI